MFVSADNLHKRVVPLFLRPDQTFVDTADLKTDLQKLDAYYWAMPEEVAPPLDDSFLVTRLWDKRGIEWRERASKPDPTDKLKDTKIIEELNRITEAAKSSDPNARLSIEETAFMQISRSVVRKKGKWDRFGPEVK